MERCGIRFGAAVLALAGLTLSSCSSTGDGTLFGYSTGSQYAQEIRTVYVPIFKNRTYVRGIEFQLTEEVVKQIEAKTPWKVVNDPGRADAELLGTIIVTQKHVITQHRLNEVREAEITLGVEIAFRNCRTGQPIADPRMGDSAPLLAPHPDILDVPPPAPVVIVQRSAAFIPELGESLATAKQEVVKDLAEQIVSMMEMPW